MLSGEQYIIKKLIKGDIASFDILYKEYSKNIYAFAYSKLKNIEDSEGVVQDVFMSIWKNRKHLKTDTNFKSYLFTITSSRINKVFRKQDYTDKLKEKLPKSGSVTIPDDELEYIILLEKIDKLIDSLPERRRLIFLKSRKEGLSSKEIAKELGITPGAVDNQISQAIKFLRSNLNETLIVSFGSACIYLH